MKNASRQTLKLAALSAALVTAWGPVQAQDADIEALTKPQSSISAGIGGWSKDRSQQGTYDGMRDGKGYGLLDIDLNKRDDATGTWLKLRARNLGLDTRELKAEWLRQGDMGVSIDYSRIPRTNPWTFNTGLRGIGTTNMTISGAGAAAFPKQDVTLETVRDRTDLGFRKFLMPGLEFKASFKNEDKEGTRPYGLGSNALFLVEPVNSNTKQLEFTLNYVKEKFQLNGGYYASWYDTANKQLFGLQNGVAQPGSTGSPNPTPLSQPLNNQSHQLSLNGGYNFTPSTRGTFKLAYGNATQDEQLPSRGLTGVNAAFVGAPQSLNGKITTTLAELGFTSRPMPKLYVVANLRYHDVNDKTPLAGFVGSNVTGVATVHNTPHSFTTTTGKLEASYRLPQGFTVIGGVDMKNQDRSFPQFQAERFVPFRSKVEENTYRLQLRRGLTDTVSGSLAYLHSKRTGSTYQLTEAFQSDLISPFYVADRKRDKWRASVDWMPTDALGFNFNVEDARDRYANDRTYGMKSGRANLYSVDASYAASDKFNLNAWLSHDETKADQFAGRWNRVTNVHEVDKNYRLRDKGDSFGFGARGIVMPKFRLGANLQWTRNHSAYGQDVTVDPACGAPNDCRAQDGGTKIDPPTITSKLTRLHFWGDYQVQKNGTIRMDVMFEHWKTDDWTWNFANGTPFSYGTTTDKTTVTMNQNQRSAYAGVRYIYQFR